MTAEPSPGTPFSLKYKATVLIVALFTVPIAFILYRNSERKRSVASISSVADTLPIDGDVRLLRAAVVSSADAVRAPWTPGPDSLGRYVEGDVQWSPSLERGVMRLIGVPSNQPADGHYQAWVVDGAVGDSAVAGGAPFDLREGVVDRLIPLRPGRRIVQPTEFRLTFTPTGGGSRLVAVARP